MVVNSEQNAKAAMPIETIESGIMVFLHPAINLFDGVSIKALQLSRES